MNRRAWCFLRPREDNHGHWLVNREKSGQKLKRGARMARSYRTYKITVRSLGFPSRIGHKLRVLSWILHVTVTWSFQFGNGQDLSTSVWRIDQRRSGVETGLRWGSYWTSSGKRKGWPAKGLGCWDGTGGHLRDPENLLLPYLRETTESAKSRITFSFPWVNEWPECPSVMEGRKRKCEGKTDL